MTHDVSFERLRDQVKEIAGALEEKKGIPMVSEHMPLILDVQTDEWWQNVTLPMFERVRKLLRNNNRHCVHSGAVRQPSSCGHVGTTT